MSIIEQAAKRLEELRKAGVLVSPSKPGQSAGQTVEESMDAVRQVKTLQPAARPIAARSATPGLAGGQTVPATTSKQVSIDLLRLGHLGLVTPNDPRSQWAEEFRSIKRPLIDNAKGKSAAPIANGNLIMVTSALPGEGKSTCAVNLAISIAMELDNSVLLVDADVAKPSIPSILGLTTDLGLLDVVGRESMDLSEVLLRTNVDKFTLLPSGRANDRATELLASETMGQLLEEMSRRYADRIIIFDSPPLLLTSEARALAAHMGQIVMVVEAGRTTHAAVKQALAAIEACPVKLLLLNKNRAAHKGAHYGYGYYGGGEAHYGYGG